MPGVMDMIQYYGNFVVQALRDNNGDLEVVNDEWYADCWGVFGYPKDGGPITQIKIFDTEDAALEFKASLK